ncbi:MULTISPECIES: fumarate/nitrate reduction transcriptional regulator Fnr [Halomonadaceae]|jgi:CRP/FNR family transcriptional regulator|uniref:Fumarate/nitrate reduction transcriptional regulator Fnr n=1 Tax=Billgrantia aerodenitrificans TaxID=2733483 RepID=A0ABS9APK4_9GAMM|nr:MULTISPECIES: fumarate/nitrate reduction transcriptional regulator Fnr [Halomonas]MCE8023780.1 fumarate/nitrate reduction transcriptional regulator Fnr [Halomonas aerodenitrificans]MCE8038713.1 fumarate/nitrate reduction transcriptional regulator Fnr [Halomonas sp. MCCC 1A11062]
MGESSNASQLIRLHEIRKACSSCSLRELCLPVALDRKDTDELDRIVEHRRPLRKGEKLCRPGQPFSAIYAVLSGSLKSSLLGHRGDSQVIAFHLPSELVGLDAIGSGSHPTTIEALETTSVCKIPFSQLEALSRKIPGLQHQLLRVMSKEIFDEHELLQVVSRRTAEQRLAIMLINLGQRFGRRGLSRTRFRLPMSRLDLGNYLGLAPETTSRAFRRFIDQGLLKVTGKEVELLDPSALQELTDGMSAPFHSRKQR